MTKPDLISSFGTLWPLWNLKSRRLRSVLRLCSWQPTALNLYILLLCMHENRRRFESQNASHMALFSASRPFCFQWITRHNANYAQMPGCPLCSILAEINKSLFVIVSALSASLACSTALTEIEIFIRTGQCGPNKLYDHRTGNFSFCFARA